MSIIKESMKRQKNILTIEIRKELNLLPTIIKEKKIRERNFAQRNIKNKRKNKCNKKRVK